MMTDEGPREERDRMDEESAEREFARFAEAMDLDFNEKGMDDEDRKGFYESKRIVLRELQRGSLVIDDDGQPVYTARHPKEQGKPKITFYEWTGGTLMEADKKKKDHDVTKMIAMIGEMSRQSIQRYSKMPARDFKVVQAIALLFLG